MPPTNCLAVLLAASLLLGCTTAKRSQPLPAADSFQLLPPPPGYYTPQTGRLYVSRNDSAQRMIYATDTSEMTISTSNPKEVHLATGLFQHGVLTPELLLHALNHYKLVDHRGDTTIHAGNINARDVELLQLTIVPNRPKTDDGKKTLTIEARVRLSAPSDHPLSVEEILKRGNGIFLFELSLKGKSSPASDLAAYLREVTILRLLYTGMEI